MTFSDFLVFFLLCVSGQPLNSAEIMLFRDAQRVNGASFGREHI